MQFACSKDNLHGSAGLASQWVRGQLRQIEAHKTVETTQPYNNSLFFVPKCFAQECMFAFAVRTTCMVQLGLHLRLVGQGLLCKFILVILAIYSKKQINESKIKLAMSHQFCTGVYLVHLYAVRTTCMVQLGLHLRLVGQGLLCKSKDYLVAN